MLPVMPTIAIKSREEEVRAQLSLRSLRMGPRDEQAEDDRAGVRAAASAPSAMAFLSPTNFARRWSVRCPPAQNLDRPAAVRQTGTGARAIWVG